MLAGGSSCCRTGARLDIQYLEFSRTSWPLYNWVRTIHGNSLHHWCFEQAPLRLNNYDLDNFDNTHLSSRVAAIHICGYRNEGDEGDEDGNPPTMNFPVLPEQDFWFPGPNDAHFRSGRTEGLNLDKSLLDIASSVLAGANSNRPFIVKTHWVALPDRFGSASAGLLILMSVADEEGHQRQFDLGMSCTIDARWAPGQNWLTASQSDWALAGYSYPTKSTLFGRRPGLNSYERRAGVEQGTRRMFLPDPKGG